MHRRCNLDRFHQLWSVYQFGDLSGEEFPIDNFVSGLVGELRAVTGDRNDAFIGERNGLILGEALKEIAALAKDSLAIGVIARCAADCFVAWFIAHADDENVLLL